VALAEGLASGEAAATTPGVGVLLREGLAEAEGEASALDEADGDASLLASAEPVTTCRVTTIGSLSR